MSFLALLAGCWLVLRTATKIAQINYVSKRRADAETEHTESGIERAKKTNGSHIRGATRSMSYHLRNWTSIRKRRLSRYSRRGRPMAIRHSLCKTSVDLLQRGFGATQDFVRRASGLKRPLTRATWGHDQPRPALPQGRGVVAQDYLKAREWYEKAADKGRRVPCRTRHALLEWSGRDAGLCQGARVV